MVTERQIAEHVRAMNAYWNLHGGCSAPLYVKIVHVYMKFKYAGMVRRFNKERGI